MAPKQMGRLLTLPANFRTTFVNKVRKSGQEEPHHGRLPILTTYIILTL
jgi:hypothetical protein